MGIEESAGVLLNPRRKCHMLSLGMLGLVNVKAKGLLRNKRVRRKSNEEWKVAFG